MNNENETRGNLRDVLNVIFKHRTKIITIFLTVVTTVTVGSFFMSPVYESSSKILVRFGRENIFTPTNRVEGRNAPVFFDSSKEERLNSEMEILKGRNLIEKVIKDAGVTNIYPDMNESPLASLFFPRKLSALERATLTFEKNLTIEGVKKSDIIGIKFRHTDPKIAALVVNKVVDAFFQQHLNVYKQSQKYNFFDDQVRAIGKELQDSEKELEVFRNENKIYSLVEQKTFLLRQISDLEIQLANTRSEIRENDGKMQALGTYPLVTLSEAKLGEETDFNPYTISGMRNTLYDLKLKEKELLGKYTEQNVAVVNIRKAIENAQALLAKEEKTYHDKAITSISHTLDALREKEKSLEEHLAGYRQELGAINNVEQPLKALERRVTLNETNYKLYFENREEARISDAMDSQGIANISVIQPALPPIKPMKPKKLLNIILSIILGGVAGLAAAFFSEYHDRKFNTIDGVKKHLGTQVLASIYEMK